MPHTIPGFLANRLAKPAAVFGGAVSGQGTVELLARLGVSSVVYDRKGGEAEPVFGADDARRHGLVVYSPGFAPDHPWIGTANDAGCLCLGELDFAALFWTGPVIAITGTNGKTTLTEFLAHVLNKSGRAAMVAGNIGYPFSRLVQQGIAADAIAVCEISSFQAETIRHLAPAATLWTNFAEDHLERHGSMADYFDAKAQLLARTAPGMRWVGSSVAAWMTRNGRTLEGVNVINTVVPPADPRLAGTPFAAMPQRENFEVAKAYWCASGLDVEILYAAAAGFRIGRHRLSRVATKDGVTFWNDSKATNFHAVIGALENFDAPVRWIGGGRSKGGDIAGFVRDVAARISRGYLIGETAVELERAAVSEDMDVVSCGSLLDAVTRAWRDSRPGEHILLSPGFASFDQFKGYEDRGDQFEAIVADIKSQSI
ncbi:MAG TPA: UDP-N-acetylmuramoyl-L-alanine--D-glutamate ligase [Opitutaceae bacterium]|nr:UDP-N-acetylmuramoyl-L-alanine--D-glutamate ligase [Opitutaceae bacterium]